MMPPALISEDESDYVSSEDSDFAPDAANLPADDEDSESKADEGDDAESDARNEKPQQHSNKKQKGADEEAEDVGIENSGDEAVIEKGLRKKRRQKGKKGEDHDDDEDAEGGLIKTRSMRAQEKIEKKPLVDTSAATVDVDTLWANMLSGRFTSGPQLPTSGSPSKQQPDANPNGHDVEQDGPPSATDTQIDKSNKKTSPDDDGPDAMITIKRTYNFAGKVHTEDKVVRKDSAEARLYLQQQQQQQQQQPKQGGDPKTSAESEPDESDPLFPHGKRASLKARRSIFEPASEIPSRTDLRFGARDAAEAGLSETAAATANAKKLNTVEKSAMDWAGFVDKEGIKDELDAAGKSKGAYRARQEFLARVENKKEEEARRARGVAPAV